MHSLDPALPDPSLPDGPGAEPAYCPACDLRHTRRPDWLCPKCGMPVETEAAASLLRRPRKRGRAADAEYDPADFPLGSFVAGAVLVLSGLGVAIAFARHPLTDHRWPLVGAMVLLPVLGFELLIKVSAARWIVVAVAALAAIVAGDDVLRARWPDLTRDPLPPAVRTALHHVVHALSPLQLVLAAALAVGTALLVAGRPGRARLAIGVLLAIPLGIVEVARAFGW